MAPALPNPIQNLIEATNRGDTEAFLACFTADAFLSDWGREYRGRDGIAKWNETDNIGVKSQMQALDVAPFEGGYIVTMKVTGNGFNGTGRLHFMLAGKLINRLIIE
jgi:hypothetical protein